VTLADTAKPLCPEHRLGLTIGKAAHIHGKFHKQIRLVATRECRAPHPLARDRFYKLTWPQIVKLYRLTLDQSRIRERRWRG
jgi:hypothetical protein